MRRRSATVHTLRSLYISLQNILQLDRFSDPVASAVASRTRFASRCTFLSPNPCPIWRTTSHPGSSETAQSPKFRYTPPTSAMIGMLFKPYCPPWVLA